LTTLITYLVAAALAIGYACVHTLPQWRRAVAGALAMILTIAAGELLFEPATPGIHVVALPCVLAVAVVTLLPRRRTPTVREMPRHTHYRRPAGPLPVLHDPWAALYASVAAQVDHRPTRTATPVRVRSRALPGSLRRAARCRRP